MSELFCGSLSNIFTSLEEGVTVSSENTETFMTKTVDISKFKTLSEALDAEIKGEVLEGDNMYYSE